MNMNKPGTQQAEARLLVELAKVSPVRDQRAALEISQEADLVDRTLASANRDLAASSFEIADRKRRDVRMALGRLREGTYGYCQSCGEEIAERRLQALPWAAYCITCQECQESTAGAHYLAAA
jgi:DnaK suppressor protein